MSFRRSLGFDTLTPGSPGPNDRRGQLPKRATASTSAHVAHKEASGATVEDAETLAKYERLIPLTNAFNDFVQAALASMVVEGRAEHIIHPIRAADVALSALAETCVNQQAEAAE